MEIADWDDGSITLHGLHHDMKPSHVRQMVDRGFITPASDNEIRPLLKQMVVYLYNHQKNSPIFQASVRPLLSFLCSATTGD